MDRHMEFEGNLDCPSQYDRLAPEDREVLDRWIGENFEPAKRGLFDRTSYGLKHDFAREGGSYIVNGAMKGAMVQAGFRVLNPDDVNWFFAIQRRIPDGFFKWCTERYAKRDNRFGDFAGDIRRDLDFPRAAVDRETIASHLRTKRVRDDVMRIFEILWRRYQKALQAKRV